ncbi:GlcG/HbpS family heme-binding protein [Aequorivita capsosiphonis]|uniref:GlcG/HbpS family heme-binding protein n=1 Tax=Aequorivita capsosiphonis TaxID=487317 RepID=UPI00042558A0|nr:heme-binding protein [Aequorivita capsosiphonis]
MNIKHILIIALLLPIMAIAQTSKLGKANQYIDEIPTLNLLAANQLLENASNKAKSLGKNATIVILDASGEFILSARGKNIGPHNTEAARRKAYTSLSTKTGTLALMRMAQSNPDSQNLNTLPELLLLSGGAPIYWEGNVVGSIGIAGGGSAENDDMIAKAAEIPEMGITTTNTNK